MLTLHVGPPDSRGSRRCRLRYRAAGNGSAATGLRQRHRAETSARRRGTHACGAVSRLTLATPRSTARHHREPRTKVSGRTEDRRSSVGVWYVAPGLVRGVGSGTWRRVFRPDALDTHGE